MPIATFQWTSSPRANVVFDALSEDGVVIVRQALSEEAIWHLKLLCTAAFAIMDIKTRELEKGLGRPDDPLRRHVDIYRQLQYIGDDLLITLLSQAFLTTPGLASIANLLLQSLARYFPFQLRFLPTKSVIRRQCGTRQASYVVWHRDAHAVQTAELGNVFNFWVPCDSVGVNRASLDVVLGSNKVMKQRRVDYAAYDNPSDQQVRAEFGEDKLCTAFLDAGDVLVFSEHTIHRTQSMGDNAQTRISGEFRFSGLMSDHEATPPITAS